MSDQVIRASEAGLFFYDATAGGWRKLATGLAGAVAASLPRDYIDGFTLAWTSPTTLSISDGVAADSTNASVITGTSFTKSISGTWAAGTGSNGMRPGTVAASTWYHVFAIVNSGAYDVYFDTSATGANAPGGTTALRRIGSFYSNASSQIAKFVQLGDEFIWDVPISEWDDTSGSAAAQIKALIGVPTGVKVFPRVTVTLVMGPARTTNILFTTLDQTDTAPSATARTFGFSSSGAGGIYAPVTLPSSIYTNTSGQIRYRQDGQMIEIFGICSGWRDLRGATISVGSSGGATVALQRNYIDGLIMSWVSATSIAVSAGVAMDSTNANAIIGTAFTKSISGVWAAGSGSNGMRPVVVAANSWYHVYAIINNGAYDVYFDASASGANPPPGTTAIRRIGSFLTNASSQISKFVQAGDLFSWDVPVTDYNVNNPGTARVTITLSTPLGLRTYPIATLSQVNGSTNRETLITSLDQTDSAPTGTFNTFKLAGAGIVGLSAPLPASIYTNTLSQIGMRMDNSGASDTNIINTHGWRDLRGKDS